MFNTHNQTPYDGLDEGYDPNHPHYSHIRSQTTAIQYDIDSPELVDAYNYAIGDPVQHQGLQYAEQVAGQDMPSNTAYYGQGAVNMAAAYDPTPPTIYVNPPQSWAASSFPIASPLDACIQAATDPYDPFGFDEYQIAVPGPDQVEASVAQGPDAEESETVTNVKAILSRLQSSTEPGPRTVTADSLDLLDLRRKFNAQITIFRLRNAYRRPDLKEFVESAISEFEAAYKVLEEDFAARVLPVLEREQAGG